MHRILTLIFALCLCSITALAQPLSGSFTVGGTTPDFATLQDAANALKARGVSSPTFFNIRPGTYTRNGGNNTVLLLDSVVTGLSAANRITFQPDQASGGNVSNVILEMNRSNLATTDPSLVSVRLDFVTLRNLTFRHVDSLNLFSNHLVRLNEAQTNPVIDDFVLTGCRFFGGPNRGSNIGQGTDYGISGSQNVSKATITNNRFSGIRWAVSIENGAGPRAGTVVVEDNEVFAGFGGGTAIQVAAANATVRRNRVDFTGGIEARAGIAVLFATVGLVERNIVMNARGGNFTGIRILGIEPQVIADSVIVANNIIMNNIGFSTTGMEVTSRNTKVVHNTIITPPTPFGGVNNLILQAVNCTVVNNIFMYGPTPHFSLVFDFGRNRTDGLISDYNIIFFTGGAHGGAVFRDGVIYPTLDAYQTATGLDTNSVYKEIQFVVDSLGLRLDACQSQDGDLRGIPIPSVRVDFHGAPRDSVSPFIGAVEGTPRPFDIFGAAFKLGLPGTPFSIAAGRFDNLLADGLAIPDYDNKNVRLYHNNFSTRSFELSGTISMSGFRPVVAEFFDLDEDANLDLIVGCDANIVAVFWGDGIGGFPLGHFVETLGRVRSIAPGPRLSKGRTVALTMDNGFLPTASWLGYLVHEGGRDLCTDVQRAGNNLPDTLRSTMVDLVVKNLGGDGALEVAALTLAPLPPRLILINDIIEFFGVGSLPCPGIILGGTVNQLQLGTGNLTPASSILAEDFDGDLDLDLLATGANENECILARNQGNFTFTAEPIPTRNTRAIAALDYENDGDLDFVAANRTLNTSGITLFLNDGSGRFTERTNCFLPFAGGEPSAMIAGDFDLDGMTDIAITTFDDSLFVLYNLGGAVTRVDEQKTSAVPDRFSLSQNYPNPFNPTTQIAFSLPGRQRVVLKVFDVLGRQVQVLLDEVREAGKYLVVFEARSLASGVYFCQLSAGSQVQVRRMLLLR